MNYYVLVYWAFIYFLLLIDAALLLISAIGVVQGRKSEYARHNGTKPAPRALVMIPCRGIDINLNGNVSSAMHQSYRNYDAVAIVDSMEDPCINVLKETGIAIMKSDGRKGGRSGKVRAISTALSSKKGYDIYVVLDSDVRVGRHWLSELIAPLSDRRIGISTTFPYFNPISGFWSRMKMVWGFVGQGLMESKATRFGWGGSLAFRKELIAGRKEMKYFGSMVSDDIAITRIAKAKGLGIAYCRNAEATVDCRESFGTFWEWSNRQAALSIAGSRRVLYYGLAFYWSNILLFISGIALSVLYSQAMLVLLLPFAVGAAKAYSRAKDVSVGTLAAFTISQFIYLANLIVASRMKSISWRGRIYDISGEPERLYQAEPR
ncbi:glycosyltransferase family 2 protein [Candidatus Marsarchaeota archaeon]|jgi:cellulose synthase/poly-beta-1,6-N-acetylglucosamine synthase-like glycosyltransferase|nr:glycosyltransferase family 2 protein [Candidatus Marsarchaeota archaeon]